MTAKNNGVYYTPQELSDFIAMHSLRFFLEKSDLAILEPSCGDGVFVESLNTCLNNEIQQNYSIECVEIDKDALSTARARPRDKLKKVKFINTDFFDFLPTKRKKYDLIIGNPPYVVRKRLSEKTIDACKDVYATAGLSGKYFRNLWGAFLLGSIKLLSEEGVLAYVLPAELLQVKFSEELRSFLTKTFERVEIVSFKEIIFENIEQDTILLFCYKQHSEKGLFFSQRKNTKDLIKNEPKFIRKRFVATQNMKWTSHILTQEELNLLLKLKERFRPISFYCTAVAGIVTAANNFFIVNDETLEQYELSQFALPIVQRGIHINGSAVFTKESFAQLKVDGKSCNLLHFKSTDVDRFSSKVEEYIATGVEEKIDQRYKCKERLHWYSVPGIHKDEGFFFKRSHLYPKILSNEADVFVTDSAYRIKMLDGNCINNLVYSFYNSLTLSLAELEGRYYGGGVLELTPNEFKSVSIPYVSIDNDDFSDFAKRFENKTSIDEILTKSDDEILNKKYGISVSDVEKLQKIKRKLTERRLGKAQTHYTN